MTSNNRIAVLASALCLAALIAAPPARATLKEAATLDEKVENAAAIVVGKVIRQETRFDPSRRWILTYTTFQVEKSLKGGTGGEITLVTPGGRVGDVNQTTIGVPIFEEGRENVVFVRNSAAGPTVLYHDQGAYDLETAGGERVVKPVATEAVHIDTQRGMAVAPEPVRTLREFEGAVRAAERRAYNRMETIRQRQSQQQQVSIWDTVEANKWLFALAAAGLLIATIQFLRR